ncbi:MAG: bifunctional phosphoribosylaminoimidazolecarboxamide formyltransferase/inosine monophosphate cyclohydrolase [Deltaproteobacteria bacterium CG11_big_fil_rev_8_21_14_0_20_47_16]|nr:MAG: bifunctional phosphoribosylaminoimidazolecarboxamide formyltransferase/inosine monophosphate cyclohydrolase [Deltaproteobacteria bacterium CG11_big_fil_rev_8_21_14_0_20_47_16]
MIERALISVSDKSGILDLAKQLHAMNIKILSTGGTAKVISGAGIPVVEVSDFTGFPEILDGRVKTLHPKVHAGLLARRDIHDAIMQREGLPYIDLLVVNFYPFEKAVSDPQCSLADAVEQIDIGGPGMVRSAAKNYTDVAVVTDPSDYEVILRELSEKREVTRSTRFRLAQKAFARVAEYDAAICHYLTQFTDESQKSDIPETVVVSGRRIQSLRYGENPHQSAAWYQTSATGLSAAQQLQGKELSYNNILDADAALETVRAFSEKTACVIVKHGNPCGIGVEQKLNDAFVRAQATDPVSSFGGIVALSRPLDVETAEAIAKTFFEVVMAPGFDAKALAILESKKNLRLLKVPCAAELPTSDPILRSVQGGFLWQMRDCEFQDLGSMRIVTTRAPSREELLALDLGWRAAHYVKSNAIVFANATGTVAIGAGQMSRVDSVQLAVMKAQLPLKGTVVASDAFFPFADGLLAAAKAGATAVVQPGGSVRDEEVIAAANQHNMAMIFTGTRHFRH